MTTAEKYALLRQAFLQNAQVKDAKKGYVVAEDFNLAIKPHILTLASQLWAELLEGTQLDAVIGLPDAGARLVSILAGLLEVPQILPAKRSTHIPGAWKNVVSYSNTSFTTGRENVTSHIGFVQPQMRLALVDDVVANGDTGKAAIEALQAIGVTVVGLVTLFDKAWQNGAHRIMLETGVPVHSLISIQEITSENKVVLAQPENVA